MKVLKIDMDTECWFCRRKTKELIPIVNKILETDIEKEAEMKKRGHPYAELLFDIEDVFKVIKLGRNLEIPICLVCEEILSTLIYEHAYEQTE